MSNLRETVARIDADLRSYAAMSSTVLPGKQSLLRMAADLSAALAEDETEEIREQLATRILDGHCDDVCEWQTDDAGARLHCTGCGRLTMSDPEKFCPFCGQKVVSGRLTTPGLGYTALAAGNSPRQTPKISARSAAKR